MSRRTDRLYQYDKIHRMAEAAGPDILKESMRELCREDLFYLLFRGLSRFDINCDFLFDRCRDVQLRSNGMLDLWAREHYKLEPLSNEIRTVAGWTTIGALRVGDQVFSPEGAPASVLAINDTVFEEELYEFTFSSHQGGPTVTVTAGHQHQWDVVRCVRGLVRDSYAEDVLDSREIFAYTEAEREKKKKRWLKVRPAGPLRLPRSELPVDPYLLGVWLGDGCSTQGGITNSDTQLYAMVGGGSVQTPMGNTFRYTPPGLTSSLRSLGALPTSSSRKHIPDDYLNASFDDRLALLQGLMDTDGHFAKNGQCRFHTISSALADGVEDIAASLGLIVSRYTGVKGMQVITFPQPRSFSVFRLDKHQDKVAVGERRPVYWYIKGAKRVEGAFGRCIQVEGGRYVTGRNYIPTRNSTIITFACTIQNILRDPEVTVGIFSHTKPIAKSFLRQIKYELETNARLKFLFPEILYNDPKSESSLWSEDKGIVVKRQGNPNAATVEAHGLVDGQPTSKHYQVLVYDDVVTRESVTTPEMIKKTTEAWELSRNLGTHGGVTRYIGTRYHYNDTWGVILDREAATPRIHPATEDGTPGGEPVLLTRESLEVKRREMGNFTFACQMLQNPKADEIQGFSVDDIRYSEVVNHENLNLYLICDPANEKKKNNDYTTFFVVGLGQDRNYYVVDIVRDRLNLTERTQMLFSLHQLWEPMSVIYEHYGMQSDIQHIEYVQEQMNYRFEITPVGGSTPKNDRIRRLIPVFESHRMFLPRGLLRANYEGRSEDLVQTFIREEFRAFPVMVHDDMLDCLSRIVDPQIETVFPVRVKPPRVLTQAERDWQHITGVSDSVAFNLD